MVKDFFTGGERMQRARNTQGNLRGRNRLSPRQAKDLADARRITRRHMLRLTTVGIATTAAAVGGGVASWLLLGPESQPQQTTIPNTELKDSDEQLQQSLEKATRQSVDDFRKLFNVNLNADEIIQRSRFVNTSAELYQLGALDKTKEVDFTGRIEAQTFDQSHPMGKTIVYNKESIALSMEPFKDIPEFTALREEYLEMLIKHELVHYTAQRYESPQLHAVVYEKIFANSSELRGKRLTLGYVQGADIIAFVEGDPLAKNPFHLIEEAEAFLISDFAMRARGRKLTLVPFAPEDQGTPNQVAMFSRLLNRIDPDLFKSVPTLFNLRRKAGGREELCNLLKKAYPDVNVQPGEELFFGMSIMTAIARGDIPLFNAMTKTS